MGIGAIAALLFGLGIIGVIYGLFMRTRASRVTDAPLVKTGEAAAKGAAVANPKGAISVEGNVTCPQPLVGPMSGKPCLYYELKVTAEWKEGETHKTKELSSEKRAARFAVDDGSGPVWVDAHEGGDFEPEEESDQSKTTGLIGGITGQELVLGHYRIATGLLSIGTKYRVHEKILPAVPRLYVCGKAGPNNEIGAPSWRALLLTAKTREDYLGHAMKSAKIALIAAASLAGVGTILGVVSTFMGGSEDKKPVAAAPVAAAPPPPAPSAPPPAEAVDTASVVTTASAAAAPPAAPGGKPGKPKPGKKK